MSRSASNGIRSVVLWRPRAALEALQMAASAGSFSTLVDADVILDRRVEGGPHHVALALAARLGDRVRLRQDVTAIADSRSRIRDQEHVFHVESFVASRQPKGPPLDELEEAVQLLRDLDWKIHDVVLMPGRELPDTILNPNPDPTPTPTRTPAPVPHAVRMRGEPSEPCMDGTRTTLNSRCPVSVVRTAARVACSGTGYRSGCHEAPQVLCRSYTGCGSRLRAA